MNKIIITLFGVALVFSGCQKKTSDLINGQTVDQRLSAALTAYQNLLTSSQYGWTFVEFTTGTALNQGAPTTGQTAAFAYYMQFNDSNKVTMFSDFDSATLTAATSSYRLKATQRPSLIFDTYSYVELPADPDPAVSQSPFGPGLGWGADFEFSFADNVSPTQLGDTIHLTGNLNGASVTMIKATKAQHDAYYNGTFAKDFIFTKIQNYFKNLSVGTKTFQITPGVGGHTVDFSWVTGLGQVQSVSTNFYQLADGIGFRTPIQALGLTVSGIQNIVFNATTSTATGTVNGSPATVQGVTAPLSYDPNGLADWYLTAFNEAGLYLSGNGFHVDGVDDAFQLDTMTYNGESYFTYVYYPGVINNGQLDLFSPFFSEYPSYLTATQPFIDTVTFLAYFNIFTNGQPMPNAVNSTDSLMGDPNGFYFILKEDGTTYDQVGAFDAKSWISWSFLP